MLQIYWLPFIKLSLFLSKYIYFRYQNTNFLIGVVSVYTLLDVQACVASFPMLWQPSVQIFLILLNILSQYGLLWAIKSRNLANCTRCLNQCWPEYRSICLDIWYQMWLVSMAYPLQNKLEIYYLELLDAQKILIE